MGGVDGADIADVRVAPGCTGAAHTCRPHVQVTGRVPRRLTRAARTPPVDEVYSWRVRAGEASKQTSNLLDFSVRMVARSWVTGVLEFSIRLPHEWLLVGQLR